MTAQVIRFPRMSDQAAAAQRQQAYLTTVADGYWPKIPPGLIPPPVRVVIPETAP